MPLLALLNRLLMEGPTALQLRTSASKWRANPIRIYQGHYRFRRRRFKFKREGITNSSSANWIYDMLLLLLWNALVWAKTTTYWVNVNIIVLRCVEVSLRSINTYLWAFVQEPCVGSPSEEDFPPHYEVHLIKALVSQRTSTVQKLVYLYSDLQFVIVLPLSLQANYLYLLRNLTSFLSSLNQCSWTLTWTLDLDVFGTWYRSTLSHLSRSFEVWLQLLQQVRRCQLGNVISVQAPLNTIWRLNVELAASPNWTSSGRLPSCSAADTCKTSMSSGKYNPILS